MLNCLIAVEHTAVSEMLTGKGIEGRITTVST
jgi:predicted GNAT family acetyltransferase